MEVFAIPVTPEFPNSGLDFNVTSTSNRQAHPKGKRPSRVRPYQPWK